MLVGTPNVGKSVIFGLLTGKYATVSNYPGTTVEVTYGNAFIQDHSYLLVDTPGANSLIPSGRSQVSPSPSVRVPTSSAGPPSVGAPGVKTFATSIYHNGSARRTGRGCLKFLMTSRTRS